jgi:hypothetical protein
VSLPNGAWQELPEVSSSRPGRRVGLRASSPYRDFEFRGAHPSCRMSTAESRPAQSPAERVLRGVLLSLGVLVAPRLSSPPSLIHPVDLFVGAIVIVFVAGAASLGPR